MTPQELIDGLGKSAEYYAMLSKITPREHGKLFEWEYVLVDDKAEMDQMLADNPLIEREIDDVGPFRLSLFNNVAVTPTAIPDLPPLPPRPQRVLVCIGKNKGDGAHAIIFAPWLEMEVITNFCQKFSEKLMAKHKQMDELMGAIETIKKYVARKSDDGNQNNNRN